MLAEPFLRDGEDPPEYARGMFAVMVREGIPEDQVALPQGIAGNPEKVHSFLTQERCADLRKSTYSCDKLL